VTRLLALLAALVALAGPAAAFDPGQYASPTYNAPQVDKLLIQGPGSTGDASLMSVAPRVGGPPITFRRYAATGCTPIELFGGVADGTTDTLPALNQFVNVTSGRLQTAAADQGFCLAFGAGTYYFSAPWSYTFPNVRTYAATLRGAGSGATTFKFASSDGISFVLNSQKHSVHPYGITFATATSTYNGSGLRVTQKKCLLDFTQSTFEDLAFEGTNPDSPTLNAWGNGAEIIGLSGTSWNTVTAYGDATWSRTNGLSFKGNPTDCGADFGYSIYHNITHGIFNQNKIGILLGDYVQGVTINQSNFQNGLYGIFQPAGMQAAANVQLNVTNSQFQVGLAQVQINTGFNIAQFANNTFLMGPNDPNASSNGTVGIDLKGTSLATITGNMFNSIKNTSGLSFGGFGVRTAGLGASVASASVIGTNSLSGLERDIELGTGSINNTIGQNVHNGAGTPYVNSGVNNRLPVERGTTTANITSCAAQGIFVPHNLPGTPDLSQVQVSLALPSTGGASFSSPSIMATNATANSVTVTFQCGTLTTAGNIILNVSSSLSH
jgi:hypothetical protein